MKKIKGLALAAVVVAALAAFPAGASASGAFSATEYPATVKGSQEGALTFKFGGVSLSCINEPLTFSATLKQVEALTSSSITNPGCGLQSVNTNGCQLKFNPGSRTVDIVPAGCGPVVLTTPACYYQPIEVPAQNGIAAEFENAGSGSSASVNVTLKGEGLEYTSKSTSCVSKGTYHDLSISGKLAISATNASKSSDGVSVLSGLFLEGGSLGTGEPRIAAPVYPVHVVGERFDLAKEGQTTLFEDPSGHSVTCKTVTYDGGTLNAAVYSELNVSAAVANCAWAGYEPTVKMGSCNYRLSNFNFSSGEPKSTAGIQCGAGSAITISLGSGCSIELPAQTMGEPVGMTNPKWVSKWGGYESTVAVALAASDLDYTIKGSLCQLMGIKTGSGENGKMHLDINLRGL